MKGRGVLRKLVRLPAGLAAIYSKVSQALIGDVKIVGAGLFRSKPWKTKKEGKTSGEKGQNGGTPCKSPTSRRPGL